MILSNLQKRLLTTIVLFLLVYLIINSQYILVFSLLVFSMISIIEFFNIINKILKNNFKIFIYNISFILFIFFFSYFFLFFFYIPQLKIIIFTLLFGCIASDIGGFIIGKTFKGPKLTSISPKKTLSGALGSLLFSIVIINFIFFYLTKNLTINIFVVSILTSIGCQLGDLFFSLLKRKAKLKDTGNFLPGHGGILDRLDGILLGLPTGFIVLLLIH